jgi:hypothetical protein
LYIKVLGGAVIGGDILNAVLILLYAIILRI